MELTLRIPDKTYSLYREMSEQIVAGGGRKTSTPERLMVENIIHFAAVKDGKRWLLVPPRIRQELEALFGKGHITSPHQLAARARARVGLDCGGISLKLTDAQLAKIKRMAERAKKQPEKFLEDVQQQIAQELLGRVG